MYAYMYYAMQAGDIKVVSYARAHLQHAIS